MYRDEGDTSYMTEEEAREHYAAIDKRQEYFRKHPGELADDEEIFFE
jgi:hypothetical protein